MDFGGKKILRMGMISVIGTDLFPECRRESNNLILHKWPYVRGYDIYLHSVCDQNKKKLSGSNFFSHFITIKFLYYLPPKKVTRFWHSLNSDIVLLWVLSYWIVL